MKLPDINVWLALVLSHHTHHDVVSAWFETQSVSGSILLCRQTQQGLVRLLSLHSVMNAYGNPALTNREAWGVIDALMADFRIGFVNEPVGVEPVWKRFALCDSASSKLWMDSWFAAVAACGGYQMVTLDKAFSQFKGLDLFLLG